MFCKISAMGRLTSDPKIIPIKGGENNFVTFTLATNRWDGKEEVAEYIDMKAFQKTAERISKLTKGALIFVEASYTTEKWEKDGVERKKTVGIVNSLNILPSGKPSEGTTTIPAPSPGPTSRSSAPAPSPSSYEEELEDPFE